MTAADNNEPSTASSGEMDNLPDLLYRTWLNIQLGKGMESPCPGVMLVRSRCTEGNSRVSFGELEAHCHIHGPGDGGRRLRD